MKWNAAGIDPKQRITKSGQRNTMISIADNCHCRSMIATIDSIKGLTGKKQNQLMIMNLNQRMNPIEKWSVLSWLFSLCSSWCWNWIQKEIRNTIVDQSPSQTKNTQKTSKYETNLRWIGWWIGRWIRWRFRWSWQCKLQRITGHCQAKKWNSFESKDWFCFRKKSKSKLWFFRTQ